MDNIELPTENVNEAMCEGIHEAEMPAVAANLANDLFQNDENEITSGYFQPITPKSSSVTLYKAPKIRNKPIPTKTMVNQAIKSLSANTRKGFSLASIRKYILQNYFSTDYELKPRMGYIKKFVRNALENGQLKSIKGTGLTGSFRVPPTSLLHKNADKLKKSPRKLKKSENPSGKKRQSKAKKPTMKRRTKFSAAL